MSRKTKVWLILAALLIVIGSFLFVGVMTVLNWDFTKLSTSKFETNEFIISEKYHDISISTKTADILFLYSESTETKVVCYEQMNMKHTVSVKDGVLEIHVEDTRKWYEYIGISFLTPKITVYVPQGAYGDLTVHSATGNVEVPEGFDFQRMDISVSTGAVSVSGVTCDGDMGIYVTTGRASITDVRCNNLRTAGSTGDLYMRNVIAAETLSAERATGSITLEKCDAAELYLKTSTGNVTGSLLSEKIFTAQTGTGHVDVPDIASGGKCEIYTGTGSIKITLE